MTDLDATLAALSPEKRALFEKLLAEQGVETEADTTFPLSVTQQGMWFLEQLRPHNPAYVIPAALRLRGRLDAAVLRAALNDVVARHEALRTVFPLRDGRPVQLVRDRLTLDLPETDLSDAPPAGAALERHITAALADPFDLAEGPLLRFRLLRLGPDDHVLALALHHLVADGWSVGILVSELSAHYAARTTGRPADLPELDVQYGDFATWQQQDLRERDLSDGLAYWRGHLAGAPRSLDLATDRPRPAVQGFNGASVPFALPASVMRALTALAKEHRATTYTALLAAFHVLLHRYGNQDDVVVGVPTAGRARREVEPLIGFFVNTLPVRAHLGGGPSFHDVLERVRDACFGAYAHQDIPFEKVVEDLRPPRDLSRPPVFQVSLSYQSDPLPALTLDGLRITRVPLAAQGARFDLELQFFAEGDRLAGWFEYDRDLFDEPTVVRMADAFRWLIEGITADPAAPVDTLPLLDDDARERTLALGHGPDAEWPGHGWIHQDVEERVRQTPDAEAVRFEGTSLTYRELNARANRLAHHLIGLGVGRDVLVGVAMERSLDLVTALLAVLKAGGAYVPLDPGLPADRLADMLDDAATPVLLTHRAVLDALPPLPAGSRALCLDEAADALAAAPDHDPDVPVGGEDLAYVIYTSGSTGRPKGVMNVHAAIRNRLLWMQDAYGLDATDRVLQKTPFSFDVSVWEFFWPLMTGATLVVARPEGHKDARYLAATVRAEAVTTVHFVPSMLQLFLTEPDAARCTGLRRVVCSGEALPAELRDRFLAALDADLHNLYGPTEAAVDVTAWTCRREESGPVPIGHAIANTRMYVLDRHLRPVPAGVPGELHIGGRNLARGYLNRPELTEERFVPDPFATAPGARLYKTGDLARHRADGALEFLGRLDHQVKIRGLRIELGEIEARLAAHPRVREAVVTAREHAPGDVRLTAYLTADGTAPQTGDLLTHLKEYLPAHMVPAAFLVLPALPLTPNGKTDRAALPEPDTDRPDLATSYVAPDTGLEDTLAALWREALGVERVGVHDNFFDLGGHSLLLAEVRGKIADRLGTDLTMVELFQYPTVGSLARYLDGPMSFGGTALDAQRRAESRRQSHNRRRQAADRRSRSRNGR
ncbi:MULTISPECIES: amino acid adenylation domain-containing protein [Streptomyces]|uniref:Amino acid adenylation domain-containing protein n=1 Tax=Streptomyces ramulosus TaxID=47762 RepID=A0ABW1FAV0_9ACTN